MLKFFDIDEFDLKNVLVENNQRFWELVKIKGDCNDTAHSHLSFSVSLFQVVK